MNKEEKKPLNKARAIKKFVCSITRGAKLLTENLLAVITMALYGLLVVVLYTRKEYMYFRINQSLPGYIATDTLNVFFVLAMLVGVVFILYFFSMPLINIKFERGFKRVGMYNKAGEPPFVRKYHLNQYKGLWEIEFDSTGIPIEYWRENEAEVETALNVVIADIRQGKNRHSVILDCVPASNELSACENWQERYLSTDDFKLAIGKSHVGVEYADLNITSHALIAGSTGSGKTIAMKCLLYQCIKKGARVYLADFKGGANFPRVFREQVGFAVNEIEFNKMLDDILAELSYRKKTLSHFECENITEYNERHDGCLERIILAIDEVAEIFDKSGLNKSQKDCIMEMEHKVATIARLGRAVGIHIIAGLQRPSADVLPPQIKAQMDLRLCGRCDDVLSQIVLDNTDASRKIGKSERGRFITNDGKLIQAFLFTDESLKF